MGPLVAATLLDDPDHESCATWFAGVRAPVVVPDMVIPEVAYLLARGARASVEAEFVRRLAVGRISIEHVGDEDCRRSRRAGRRGRPPAGPQVGEHPALRTLRPRAPALDVDLEARAAVVDAQNSHLRQADEDLAHARTYCSSVDRERR